jgi:hypothetical protein
MLRYRFNDRYPSAVEALEALKLINPSVSSPLSKTKLWLILGSIAFIVTFIFVSVITFQNNQPSFKNTPNPSPSWKW